MRRVTIVDYGMGNLLSVSRAFQHCGADVLISESPKAIDEAQCLILPGVGAFADGMKGLSERGLIEPIRKFASSDRPFLGICLGMQMMFESSEEFGVHEGLGLVHGTNKPIPATSLDNKPHKIPHIGWNELLRPSSVTEWKGTILEGVGAGASAYFVHSFTAIPKNDEGRLADADYDGRRISAAIKVRALFGCQFHPEKSGEIGLKILRNFLNFA